MNIKKTKLYRELWYFYYHCIVYKKPGEYWGYIYNRFWVRRKIRHISPIRFDIDPSYTIHFLCSHRDIDLLLWSLASWVIVVPKTGAVFIHEDGSFTAADRNLITRIFPEVQIVDLSFANSRLKDWLQDSPSALKMREEYQKHILILKLIDPQFVGNAEKKLILDTDILWFKQPKELINILTKGEAAMQYGDAIVPINSGMVAYGVERFRIGDLETYAREHTEGKLSHFIEQDGYAWILGRTGVVTFLPREEYIVRGEVSPKVVAKHFTGPRREDFWREGVARLSKEIL